jgi:hypothetical protein
MQIKKATYRVKPVAARKAALIPTRIVLPTPGNQPTAIIIRQPTEAEIAGRAYQIYKESGCQPGRDLDNWFQAEYELRHMTVRQLAQQPIPKPTEEHPHHRGLLELIRAKLN